MADILTSNLYPPIIDSFMPAFVINNENRYCIVKFKISDMNTIQQINTNAIQVIIKNQKNNLNSLSRTAGNTGAPAGVMFKTLEELEPDEEGYYYITIDPVQDLKDGEFYQDQLYKLQIRFTLSESEGGVAITENIIPDSAWINTNLDKFSEWSSVCLLKRISEPDIVLNSLTRRSDETELYCDTPFLKLNETLQFSSSKEDEYLSNYRVELYSFTEQYEVNNLVEKSDIIYNSEDTFINKIRYNFKYALAASGRELENNYKLKIYIVTNNLYTKTFEYNFIASAVNGLEIQASFNITPDPDQGRMKVDFSIVDNNNMSFEGIPSYADKTLDYALIFRTSNKNNFVYSLNEEINEWEEIGKVKLTIDDFIDERTGQAPLITIYDNTVESGVFYQYGIILVDKEETVNSVFKEDLLEVQETRVEEDLITGEHTETTYTTTKPVFNICDFEDVFINSQCRQLKLRYDSRITSYKRTVLENKVETIGSRYPFIRRNSATNYKQFSLNGLITFHTDDANIFLSDKDIYGGMEKFPELYHNYNIKAGINPYNDYNKEREFREKVLDFLNSGQPMLLRTMTEGNVLVRLMDLNVTPNQSLNNYICNFTATALEIDDATFENYYKYNIYNHLLKTNHIKNVNLEHSSHLNE